MEITKKMTEGTATKLSSSDFKTGKVLTEEWAPKLDYMWDDGVAIAHYQAGLKKGEIRARTCSGCNRTLVPPRMFCELCWRPTDEWTTVEDTGTINTFVISHVDWKAGRLDIEGGVRPFTPAVIELDGEGQGMKGILHLVDDVEPTDLHIGMKVKAVWKPEAEREGSITDIKYFTPIKSAK